METTRYSLKEKNVKSLSYSKKDKKNKRKNYVNILEIAVSKNFAKSKFDFKKIFMWKNLKLWYMYKRVLWIIFLD